ncbi:3-ketosteroid dehydrogenase [Brevundimonas sp. GN22]
MTILRDVPEFDFVIPVLVVGAGACGLTAAMAAADGGAEVLVLERDPTPLGSTSMSTGMIPAPGSPEQAERGIDDNPELFVQDMIKKTEGRVDVDLARLLANEGVETIQWLRDKHGVPFILIDDYIYPGHSRMRMFATPKRSGAELQAALEAGASNAGVSILTEATVRHLYVGEGENVVGVRIERPDGSFEDIGCETLILACCGFGANAEMVRRYIPELADIVYHGHSGNQGEAILWGEELGAALADMDGYQGHGGLAAGYGVPILWPLIMEGGYQVNAEGKRFSDESQGYSEQAAKVNAQPGGYAWSILDERLHTLMMKFEDYRDALEAGAVQTANSIEELAAITSTPVDTLRETVEAVAAATRGEIEDAFGRDFTGKPPLVAPYRTAKVVGALFHTQGGLDIDAEARVKKKDGSVFPNLFAGGGAARGVSGSGPAGYLAGHGLLTATTLGKLAGRAAAKQVAG